MAEKLISIIKDPHFAVYTYQEEDGTWRQVLDWCEYKLLSTMETEEGTEIITRSALDEHWLVDHIFPDEFYFAPWYYNINFDLLQRFIRDGAEFRSNDIKVERDIVFDILKKDINNPHITKDVRDALNSGTDYVADVPIHTLPFSVRLINCLHSADIDTIGDLLRVSKASLMKIRCFGKKSLREIKDYYAANGYEFGTEYLQYDESRDWRHSKWYLPKEQQ